MLTQLSPADLVHGLHVFRGLPWLSPACSRRWLGDRWFAFSSPPDKSPRISIVSSRLSQRLDLETWWFDLLRTAVLQADRPSAVLPVISGTTPAEFVAHACQLFGGTLLSVCLPAHSDQPEQFPRSVAAIQAWLDVAATSPHTALSENSIPSQQLLVSPLIPGAPPDGWQDFRNAIPLADRLLFALATRIIVLRCRSGGHISQLIHHHLHDSPRATVPLMVASDHQGRFPDVLVQRHAGWIPWVCVPASAPSPVSPATGCSNQSSADVHAAATPTPAPAPVSVAAADQPPPLAASNSASSSPLESPEDWLCHWTRAALGPWPGETRQQYLDQLILGQPDSDRSALATLLRILLESRLRASSEAIRGGFAVTAFTQVPLSEFRCRRIFRSHRRRYDFEPWGIAIRREALVALGARPVIYGTEELWPQLPTTDQPFYQKISQDGRINTVTEREWRLPGDLPLSSLAPSDLVVFVNSEADARTVRQHGLWNVLVIPPASAVPTESIPTSVVASAEKTHSKSAAMPQLPDLHLQSIRHTG